MWNRISVLTKLYTGIGEIVYRYWQNCIPALAKLYTGIGKIVYRYWQNCIPVFAKSYTCIGKKDQLVSVLGIWFHQYCYMISSILVYDFTNTYIQFFNTSKQFWQYQYKISLPNLRIPLYNLANTSIRFHQYQFTIWSIPVYHFANTGIWLMMI